MSRENVEATRAAFEQFSRGDFTAVFGPLADDFEFVTAAELPDAGTYRGQAAQDWMRTYIESFDGFSQEATEIIDAGDRVLVSVVQHGRPRDSDMPVESRWWQVITFRAGSVSRIETFSQRAQALEAAGLEE
jgi:ketosteroid isomerase-like protein